MELVTRNLPNLLCTDGNVPLLEGFLTEEGFITTIVYLAQNGNSWTQIPLCRSAIPKKEKVHPDDRAHLIELVEHADHYWVLDPNIYDIIEEEASYYFNNQKSLADTQAMIQDRVSLYLLELP